METPFGNRQGQDPRKKQVWALDDIVADAEKHMDAGEYVEAFGSLARKLDEAKAANPDEFYAEQFQKPARKALKQMWSYFKKDTTNFDKRSARTGALSAQTDAEVRKNIAEAGISQARNVEEFIRETTQPIDEPFQNELEHIEYTGILYNQALPFIRQQIEGYVAPLMAGERGMSDYLPVDGDMIRTNITAYLAEAPEIARRFAALSLARDEKNREAQKRAGKN